MKRTYTLKRRAEQQAKTRRRIVEAAVELHTKVGPAQTTVSMIAGRAGVQRHTFYAHFPDERDLLMACSELHLQRQPLPDPEAWRGIGDRVERLRTALSELYGWYGRNAVLVAAVLRDAELHAVLREVSELRLGPFFQASQKILGARMNARQRALLGVALSFYTFRTLTRDAGLKTGAAVESMVEALAV